MGAYRVWFGRLVCGLNCATPVLIFGFYAGSFALNTFVIRTLGLSVVHRRRRRREAAFEQHQSNRPIH